MTRRLLVMDVDSTLITAEVIELLAGHAGVQDQVAQITEAAMRGEIDFTQSLAQRVATLAGLPLSVLDEVAATIEFSPGARELFDHLHAHGWTTALVSGGFIEIVEELGQTVGATYVRANRLGTADGVLTGTTVGPVIDASAKAAALREFADDAGVALERTVAVGDGANDLEMMRIAGLSVAYRAKPVVREQADAVIDDSLMEVIDLLHDERLRTVR